MRFCSNMYLRETFISPFHYKTDDEVPHSQAMLITIFTTYFHHLFSPISYCVIPLFGGGGGCNPKKTEKPEKKPKKPVPNLKFEVAFGFFRFFSVFFSVFFGFLWYFFGFFRSELRQEIPAIQKSSKQ